MQSGISHGFPQRHLSGVPGETAESQGHKTLARLPFRPDSAAVCASHAMVVEQHHQSRLACEQDLLVSWTNGAAFPFLLKTT